MFESCRAHLVVLVAALLLAPAAAADTGTGSFTSSDPLLNGIWAGSVRTAEDMLAPGPLTVDAENRPCAMDVPVAILDGAVRDRCPYLGDESVIDRTFDASTPHWDVQRSMLEWFASAQRGDGSFPASPLYGGSIELFDYNAYWVQVLYAYVLYSGDVATARELWPNLTRLLDTYYPANTKKGLLVNPLGPMDYGYVRRHGDVVAYYNAQYVLALREAAQLATWIGANADATRWSARADNAASAVDLAFWDAKAGAFGDTTQDRKTHPQDANAFAVLAGVATKAQALMAMDYLAQNDWRDYGNTIVDTNVWADPDWGVDAVNRVYPFISYDELVARFQLGLDSSAFDLLRREWGYMLRNGPGTMWETIGPYGGPPTDIHPSWDAGWSSGAAPALSQYVLGVSPTSPGFATFTVRPHANDLTWARGDVPTPHGPIHVSWIRFGTSVLVHVAAPAGTRWTKP